MKRRKMKLYKRVLIGLLLIALVLSTAACDNSSSTPENEANTPLGDGILAYAGEGLFEQVEYGALGDEIDKRGAIVVSMTRQRSYTATIPLESVDNMADAEAILDGAKWLIKRDKGYQNDTPKNDGSREFVWENQFMGGEIFGEGNKWMKFASDEPVFSATASVVELTPDEEYALQLEFSNDYLFTNMSTSEGRTPAGIARGHSPVILDYIGYYDFICQDSEGKELGKAAIRYTAYDSFRTLDEMYKEVDAMEAYVAEHKNDYESEGIDMYFKKGSLAKTPTGLDVPYVTITDEEASLEKYQNLKAKMEEDPTAYREALKAKSGELYDEIISDYKYPIVVNVTHPDETADQDSVLEFLWRIVKAHENGGDISFNTLGAYTEEGKVQLDKEMQEMLDARLPQLFKDADGTPWTEFLGFVNGPENYTPGVRPFAGSFSASLDLEKYYDIKNEELNVKDLLDNFIFFVTPIEEVEGRMAMSHTNTNGQDQDYDNFYKIQPEARGLSNLIAQWNPIATIMVCVYHEEYLIEPGMPPHEPNIEYDINGKRLLQMAEAFGNASVANNEWYNSYKIPMRDSLLDYGEEGDDWFEIPGVHYDFDLGWDDICMGFTPMYSLLHGSEGITVESVSGNDETLPTIPYGFYGVAKFLLDGEYDFLDGQLEFFERGVNNVDSEAIRPFYVDYRDTTGAEAEAYRPRYKENNNFFPEYYVIPNDAADQKNLAAAYEMQEFLMSSGVKVHELNADKEVKNSDGEAVTVKAGSFVVDMHQAKRNLVNAAMYTTLDVDNWPGLYIEWTPAYGLQRNFDYHVITTEGAFKDELNLISEPKSAETAFSGETDGHVIIENVGLEVIQAVNTLLNDGSKVGFITSGDDKGDFVVAYSDFEKLGDFALTAKGTATAPTAKIIDKPKVFVPGINTDYMTGYGGEEIAAYGMKAYTQRGGDEDGSFDLAAFTTQMGFDVACAPDELADADVIAGSMGLNDEQIEAVKNGKPYVAVGAPLGDSYDWDGNLTANGIKSTIFSDIAGLECSVPDTNYESPMEDALVRVQYENDSLITDSYKSSNSNIMYSFGGQTITEVPDGATVLARIEQDKPGQKAIVMGNFPDTWFERLDVFEGSIQAFDYVKDGRNITVFAGVTMRQGHPQGGYGYIANAIYSKMLGEDYDK